MTGALAPQIEQIQASIAGLEAQRTILGDAIVEPAITALRRQLTTLESQSTPVASDERRLITILFSDVVGSTALAEKLDPEEWRHIIAPVQSTIGQIIVEHHGTIAQYQGDGLIAFFGAREISEDDAENAILAGLAAQQAIAWLNTHPRIEIRVGIHTGPVVLGVWGANARIELGAFGDAINVASRLQAAAPPGSVLISHDTYRYVRGVFDMATQLPLTLKGKSEPMQTYLIERARPRPFRTVTRGVTGLETQTIGRDAELAQLQQAYLDAYESRSIVWAQVIGEPGVGKSRLITDVDDWIELRTEATRFFRARAFAGDTGHPFALIRRMWFDRFQIAEDEPLAQAEAKWVKGFQALARTDEVEPAHALGLLAGLPFADSPHIGALRDDPAQVKGRALVVSRTLFHALRAEMPLYLLLEDLHWADAASMDYLMQVLLQVDAAVNGIFVLATARPEWGPLDALIAKPGRTANDITYSPLTLAPLSEEETGELARALLQRVEYVPESVVRLIVERSEGVPYYAEELVNLLIDRGVIDRSVEPWQFLPDRLDAAQLPQTLQHLLLTRLLSLAPAQRMCVQRGSIFGRHFWEGGLAAVGVMEPHSSLSLLQARGFIDAQPESTLEGEREWSFHQNLMGDVAYESVLRRERKLLHKAAGAWLEMQARQADRLDEFVDRLGAHAEAAGDIDAAADWYSRAGDHAKGRGALIEARALYERVLNIVPVEYRARRWRAMLGRNDVLARLGEVQELQASVEALLELATQLEDAHLAEAFYRYGNYREHTGNYRDALRDYEVGITAAQRAGDRRLETLLLGAKVYAQYRLGDAVGAAMTAQAIIDRVPTVDESIAVRALNNVAVYYVESGDMARAVELHREQATRCHRLGDRASEANALNNLGYDYVCLGMSDEAREALEKSIKICQMIGAKRELVYGQLNLGLAHWRSGDLCAARQAFEQVAIKVIASGDTFARAASLSYLALALEQSGEVVNAAQCFKEAAAQFEALGVRGFAVDARAGLARCLKVQGHGADVRVLVEQVWHDLHQHGTQGMEFAVWDFLACAQVFEALNEPAKSHAAIAEGYHELMQRADKISDSRWRASFLDNIPEHRAMIAKWQQSNSSNTPSGG